MIPPLNSGGALKELERCVNGGLKGIGELRMDVPGLNLADSEDVTPFINSLIKNSLILLIHASEPVGHSYIGKGRITPDVIYNLIIKYPGLKLVCAHWGGGLPFYALMPEVRRSLQNVYFDSSATSYLYDPLIFKQVFEIIGDEKILFGSDYPLISPMRILDQVENIKLPDRWKTNLLSDNAKRLLNIRIKR
jgi:uncharacterized protein